MSETGEKRRLGKGLGALIPEAVENESELREISLSRIRVNPYQPRVNFDPEKLQELAESIKEHGLVQAIVVAPQDQDFILVAGERRYRAAQIAGLTTIPAVVREFNQSTMLEVALIENIQREDLNPLEEAAAYRRLIDELNFTQETLAKRVGKSRSAIANTMRLLSLPEIIKEALIKGELTAGQARPLLGITDTNVQTEIAHMIIDQGLTAREAEKLTARLSERSNRESEQEALKKQAKTDDLDPQKAEVVLLLQRRLGTRVRISRSNKGSFLEIHYYGDEDLERLVALLLPEGIS
ncbi:MAG: ParB/RepB/Spo0J family partition protein [Bacillota bacterium]